MAANEGYFDKPIATVVDADFDAFMHQVPADIIEIGLSLRHIDFKGDMAAAETIACLAGRLRFFLFFLN
jgi:hypothetical protein